MTEIIHKLESIGMSSSLKQSSLNEMISKKGISPEECLTILKSAHEQVGLLLPDDDDE